MKRILVLLFLVISVASVKAQTFTFECVCDYLTAADSNCDICNTSIQSRLFKGVLIRKNGTAFKWIDQPYIIQFAGNNATFKELIPAGETITIALGGTPYATLAEYKDSVKCPCAEGGGSVFVAGPGIVFSGDTISAIDTSALNELQQIDTFLISGGKLYLSLTLDSVPALFVTLPVPDGSETHVTAGSGMSVTGTGTTGSPYVVTNTAPHIGTNLTYSGTSSPLTLNSSTGTDVTHTAGTGISLSGSTSNMTITNTLPDVTVSIVGAGINVATGTYPNFTITGTEVDGLVTNEGSLTVGAGTSTTSIINSNTSGSTGVTITAGTGLAISETGNVITLVNSSPDQVVSITGGGITNVTGTYPNFTVTSTEVDGSINNEGLLGVGAGGASSSVLLSNTSGATGVTINAAGILGITESTSSNGGSITLTATEVDGSVTNEAQSLNTTGTTSGVITLTTAGGAGGGTTTIAAGSGIGVAQSGGTITISNTAGTTAYVNGGNSFGAIATIGLNDNFRWDFEQNNTVRGGINTNGSWYIGSTALSTAQLNINTLGSTNNGILIAAGGALTGPNFYQATGSGTGSTATILSGVVSMISGNVETIMNNTATAGTGGGALYTAQVSATASTNDAFFKWISGAVEWSFGPDNDDVDDMKLHRFSRPSDNNGQGTIEIGYRTSDIGIAINKTGIGTTTNGFYAVDAYGKVRTDQYVNNALDLSAAAFATIALGTAAGTSPTIDNTTTSVWGNGARLRFTSGSSPTANGVICTITLDTHYTFGECASGIFARSTNASGFGYSSSFNSATRVITFTLNGTLTASTVYEFNIMFFGRN